MRSENGYTLSAIFKQWGDVRNQPLGWKKWKSRFWLILIRNRTRNRMRPTAAQSEQNSRSYSHLKLRKSEIYFSRKQLLKFYFQISDIISLKLGFVKSSFRTNQTQIKLSGVVKIFFKVCRIRIHEKPDFHNFSFFALKLRFTRCFVLHP